MKRDTTIENMRVLEEFFREKGLNCAFYVNNDSKFKTERHKGIHYQVERGMYLDTQIERSLWENTIDICRIAVGKG